jgi:sn-glycerol 3-phosphate transport system ATP-binding protein
MRIEIRKLQQTLGTTSIYVTHDQVEAMTLADLLVVMNAGRVEQIGRRWRSTRGQATAFVAAFIGSPAMNLLPVRRLDGGDVALADGIRIVVPEGFPVPERGALLGVRPEHLTEDGDHGARFDVSVEAVEALGAESFIYGQIGGGQHSLILRASGKLRHPPGARLTVSAAPENLHLFDNEAGHRLA